MDLSKITTEDIKKMSEDELRDYVRELLRHESEEQPNAKAAFLGPDGKIVELNDLAKAMGEEAVIELVVKAMNSANVKCYTMTKEEYGAVSEKIMRGEEVSDDERKIFKAISSQIDNDTTQYQSITVAVMLQVIDFAQTQAHYDPSIIDLSMVFHMFVTETMRNMPGSRTSMYQDNNGMATLMATSQAMAEDIMNTWKATLTEAPDTSMVIVALASALVGEMFAYERETHQRLAMPSIDILRNATGIGEDFFENENENEDGSNEECHCGGECECGGDCQCHNETENGSNDGKVLSFDEMMRNMLKS